MEAQLHTLILFVVSLGTRNVIENVRVNNAFSY